MKRVTRDIDLNQAQDLLERVPRARLAFADGQEPRAEPVTLLWRNNSYLVGIPKTATCQPEPGQEVALLVDEGVYYFELRAIYLRGKLHNTEAPLADQGDFNWFELAAEKTVAWDYGAMREVSGAG
jgi:hypothetical protein